MMEIVRQPNSHTCFAACVATLTGIDIDLFDLSEEAAGPFVTSDVTRHSYNIDPKLWHPDAKKENADKITIDHWAEMLDLNGYQTIISQRLPLVPSILCFVAHMDRSYRFAHAVIAAEGRTWCPSGEWNFPLTDFIGGCNIDVNGYIVIGEKR